MLTGSYSFFALSFLWVRQKEGLLEERMCISEQWARPKGRGEAVNQQLILAVVRTSWLTLMRGCAKPPLTPSPAR